MLSEGLVQNLRVPTMDITLFFIALPYNNEDNEDSKDNVIQLISWAFLFLTKHLNSPGTRCVCQFTQDRIASHNSQSASIFSNSRNFAGS